MTYQQAYEKLYTEYAVACRVYLQITRDIFMGRSGKTNESPDYVFAKETLQTATDNYWNFLDSLREKNFEPDDEIIDEKIGQCIL